MLQQTQVKTVVPYYQRFLQQFPDVSSLAKAPQDDVLHLWTGLGYYARARNLHKAAKIIHFDHAGRFPETLEAMQALPGIGRSTAGAILSFASNQHHPILDGNVKRILARYYRVQGWTGHARTQKSLWTLAEQITPKHRCDDFNQAMMDLGSSLCSRTRPQCPKCPLNGQCQAHLNEETSTYPNPKAKKNKPEKSAYLLMLTTSTGEVLLEKRPEQGIWGSLWAFPQCQTLDDIDTWLHKYQYKQDEKVLIHPEFRHTFSHYHLDITPVQIHINPPATIMDDSTFLWYSLKRPLKLGMPTPIKSLISQLAAIKNSPERTKR